MTFWTPFNLFWLIYLWSHIFSSSIPFSGTIPNLQIIVLYWWMLTLLLWLYWSCAFWYTFWFKKEFEHQLVRHGQISVSTSCTEICDVCLTLESDLVQNMIMTLNLIVPVFYVQTRIYLWLSQTIKFGLYQCHMVLTTLRLSQCTLCIQCQIWYWGMLFWIEKYCLAVLFILILCLFLHFLF